MKSTLTIIIIFIISIAIFNSCKKENTNNNQTTDTPKTVTSILQSLNGKISGEFLGRSFDVEYDTTSGNIVDTIDIFNNSWVPLSDSANNLIQLDVNSSNYIGECSSTDSILMSGIQINCPISLPYPKYLAFNGAGANKASKSTNKLPQVNLNSAIFKFCGKTYGFYSGCNCDGFDQSSFYYSLTNGTMDPMYSADNYEIQYNTSNDSIYIFTSKNFHGYTSPTNKLQSIIQHNYIFRGKYIR